ncbi:metallophosphoesterase [Paenibacillus glycanilyticus]|uniref:metallophosphoesterase n=1 Tax=Paenibacillus glycanilyticus TaxID=126569 RepID=UPI00203C4C6D|nr:metallophosphoesterase [Paenibacillus glycanilyticus]MCM3628579.1 metallophosphoesterase [Paenibacillus glycanilyticus]
MYSCYERLGYDAAVPGNHEFNFGWDKLRAAADTSEFPWLSANIVNADTEEPAFGQPYLVKWLDGNLKVVILGITTHYIPHWELASHIAGLEFRDVLNTAKVRASYIREIEQPDLFIVSYHGGFERDLELGHAAERLTGENQAYAICMEVPGIDVLITGHQHRKLAGELNGVSIVQSGCNGQALGQIKVQFERK